MNIYRSLGTLADLIADLPWPVDFFSSEDLPRFLQEVLVLDYDLLDSQDNGFSSRISLAYRKELSLGLPGLDGVKIVFAAGETEDLTIVTATLSLGNDTHLLLHDIAVALRFDPALLKPAAFEEGDPVAEHAEIRAVGTIRIDSSFNVSFLGFNALELTPVAIGSSGVVVAAEDVRLDLSRTTALPEVLAAGFDESFLGVFLGTAQVRLPKDLPELAPQDLFLKNCAIGSGGVSGILEARYFDGITGTYLHPPTGLLGVPFRLREVILEVKRNAFVQSSIAGEILLPFFDDWVLVEAGLRHDGGLSVRLSGSDGLYMLAKKDLFDLELDSLAFEVEDGVFTAKVSGQLTPRLLEDEIDWPTFDVKELSIDSQGHVRLDGGWLAVPEQKTIELFGFPIEVSKIGFGNTEDGGRWIGFSGGLKLVDGLPAGASVEGLRITWYDDGRPPGITLEGVGVELEIPEVLRFKGAVALRGRQFEGALKLELLALEVTVDGTLIVGMGDEGPFLSLYLAAELPSGIPLFATGLGIYGMEGLFTIQMEPNREEGDSWYSLDRDKSWYHRGKVGVTDLSKWAYRPGSFAFGAGVRLGTLSDNGHAFNGRLLLAIVFPGPILLLEGSGSFLRNRGDRDQEGSFRALAVLDNRAGHFLIGLDAFYKTGSGGELIDLRGGTEAFFDFNDGGAWYIHLGEKETRDRRIRASLFQLFEANAYLMLSPRALELGAWLGYVKRCKLGPVRLALEAWLEGNVLVSFKPSHFHGDIWLHALLDLKVFSFGFGLTADATLAADVFTPSHLEAEIRVSLNLPWPFSDIKVKARLVWDRSAANPRLALPLQEVAIEHLKTTAAWPLPRGRWLLPDHEENGGFLRDVLDLPGDGPPPADAPVVPLDARPCLTFGRSVHDDPDTPEGLPPDFIGVNPQRVEPAWERIGDPVKNQGPVEARYSLRAVRLAKWTGSAWTVAAASPKKGDTPKLFGAWALLPATPEGGSPAPGHTKLTLRVLTPFAQEHRSGGDWENWLSRHFPSYPCPRGRASETACFDVRSLPVGSSVPSPWSPPEAPGPTFSWQGGEAVAVAQSPPVLGLDRSLCFTPEAGAVGIAVDLPFASLSCELLLGGQEIADCIDFTTFETGVRPGTVRGVEFADLYPASGAPPAILILRWPGTAPGAAVERGLEVLLPRSAEWVELVMTVRTKVRLRAFREDCAPAAGQDVLPGGPQPQTVVLAAPALHRLRFESDDHGDSQPAALLHGLCYRCPVAAGVRVLAVDREENAFGPFVPVGRKIAVQGRGLVGLRILAQDQLCLLRLCATSEPEAGQAATPEEMVFHIREELARWKDEQEILEPGTAYRLEVETRVQAQGRFTADRVVVEHAYFQTEGPPGLARLSVPLGNPDPEKFESGLGDLACYVRETTPPTVPPSGEKPILFRPFYRAYDVEVEFNESYVATMYRASGRDLSLYLFDANDRPVLDASGAPVAIIQRQGPVEEVSFTAGEMRWISAINAALCIPETLDPLLLTRHGKVGTVLPPRVLLAPDALYTARLVPAVRPGEIPGILPVVYSFQLATSLFAGFFHHLHSYAEETWQADLGSGGAAMLAGVAGAAVGSTFDVPAEAEARAFETIAAAALGLEARREAAAVEVTRLEAAGESRGFLIRSPEPFDWARTELRLLRSAWSSEVEERPGRAQIAEVAFGTAAADEQAVDLLLRQTGSLAGWRVEVRGLPDGAEEVKGMVPLLRHSFAQGDLGAWTIESEDGPVDAGRWRLDAGRLRADEPPGRWEMVGGGTNGVVHAIAVRGGEVFAGGGFVTAGGATAGRIAVWDGVRWSGLGPGLDGPVYALAIQGSRVFVGGEFSRAGGISARNVAAWDRATRTWEDLGAGTNGPVHALALAGNRLWVGGAFASAGGKPVRNVALFDTAARLWSPRGSGVEGTVRAIAATPGKVYVGGAFEKAGATAVGGIAVWDGVTWSPVGGGANAPVAALAWKDSVLYAGGAFTRIGSVQAARVARWDGRAWSPMGSGCDGLVEAVTVGDGYVYAGGRFSAAGGRPAGRVARWSLTTGDAGEPGGGFGGPVRALAAVEEDVWAGGGFVTAAGSPVLRIARLRLGSAEIAAAGEGSWSDYRLAVRLRAALRGETGVAFRRQETGDGYALTLDAGRRLRRLLRGSEGTETVLWEGQGPVATARDSILTIDCLGGRLTGFLDGSLLFDLEDGTFSAGKVGLLLRRSPEARFAEVRVAAPEWALWYSFPGDEPTLPDGTRVRVYAGAANPSRPEETSLERRFATPAGGTGPLRIPSRSAKLRLLAPEGGVEHARTFLPGESYENVDVRRLRKADGTGLILLPAVGGALSEASYRLEMTFHRLRPEAGRSYSERGDRSPERAAIDVEART